MTAKPSIVVHMSSLHFPFEPRIYLKECMSLARHGYDVRFVTPSDVEGNHQGVTIVPVTKPRNRLHRMFIVAPTSAFLAWKQNAALFHFHDTMMLPWALVLKLVTGKPVIYDVHEDNVTGISSKPYLPHWLATILARAYGGLEKLSAGIFEIVIAERYYERRFPKNTPVLNYPAEETFEKLTAIDRQPPEKGRIRLLYAGTVAVLRGAKIMAELARSLPQGSEIVVVGRCDLDVAAQIRAIEPDEQRMRIVGEGRHVPFDEIVSYYEQPWTAALALFPENPHMTDKELTKFFEYMAAGLPIVCSDFPVWRALVEGAGAGVCVDVTNIEQISSAVRKLAGEPQELSRLGQNGRQAVATRYRWATQESNLLELYRRCLRPTRS